MAPDAIELDEFRITAHRRQTFRELTLLMRRKQDVGLDTDDKSTIKLQARERTLQGATVFSEIE